MPRLFSTLKLAAPLAALVCAIGCLKSAIAQPVVTKLMPMSVAPGQTTEIRLEGAKLSGPLTAWTSFPARFDGTAPDTKNKSNDGKTFSCKFTLSRNVSVGIGGVIFATPEGASDLMYVLIDDLPTIFDNGKNHEPREPQTLTLPAAVEGQSDGTLADYYALTLTRGQRLSIEIVAARLGHDFDAVVRLLDDAGNELVLADDDPATGADPRFVFTAPKDGHYLLELRDNRYKPGGQYRLRIGDFPLVSTTLPPVVERNTASGLEFRGLLQLPSPPSVITALDHSNATDADFNIGFKPPGSQASGWAAPLLTDLPLTGTLSSPAVSRTDVARTAPEASSLPVNGASPVPCVFYGAIETSGERDVFSFTAHKGKPLRMTALSRSAGSPAIVTLQVLSKEGKQLAESPVTESDEPVLSFTPPTDGTYQLAVQELAGRFGADFVYAVQCELTPQFSLALKNDKNNRLKYALPSGGAFHLDVQRQRSGYDGPITLAAQSSRPGWQLINATIPAKTNEVRVYIQPPLDFAPGELATLRITGRADQAVPAMSATMSTLVQLRVARAQTPYPPRWHDGLITVSAQAPRTAFYHVTAKNTTLELPRTGGETRLTLDVERTDANFKDAPLTVIPVGLPAGVTTEVTRNGNGPQETYDIRLKSTKNVVAGQHIFRYFTYAELAGQGRGIMSGDIMLTVSDK